MKVSIVCVPLSPLRPSTENISWPTLLSNSNPTPHRERQVLLSFRDSGAVEWLTWYTITKETEIELQPPIFVTVTHCTNWNKRTDPLGCLFKVNCPQRGLPVRTKVNLAEKPKDSSCLYTGTNMPKIQYAVWWSQEFSRCSVLSNLGCLNARLKCVNACNKVAKNIQLAS